MIPQAYPQYRDSGVEWVGNIPTHWERYPLFAIASERDETNTGMQENNLLSLSYGSIVKKDINANDGLLPASFETYQIVERDDIVWRLTDLQNDKRSLRTAIVRERGIITSAYLATRPTAINPDFMNYMLRAYDLTKVFYSMGGGLRQSMKFSDVKWLPVLIPPATEQAAIVSFLDIEIRKIDALLKEQQRLVELLKEKRQAVISYAVTQGLDRNAKMQKSHAEGLTEIPEHWHFKRLKHLSTRIGDGLHGTPEYVDESNIFFINGNNLVDGIIRINDATRCVSSEVQSAHASPIGDNTVLISINGTIGNLALYDGQPVVLSKSVAYINCISNLDRDFLFFAMQAGYIKRFFESTIANTTIYNLSLEALRNVIIGHPPIEEQQQIAKVLRTTTLRYDAIMGQTERGIALLQERRSALISAAVTGKIDVRAMSEVEVA